MKLKSMALASLVAASLAAGTAADAQIWAPPPPPPYGFLPPPGPPPLPGPRVVEKRLWGQPGFQPYSPHCWTEYRNNGWEMVKFCQ